MIVARWSREKGKMTITLEGHEDAPEGEALVCCAVSTVMQTAVCGLIALQQNYPNTVQVLEVAPEPTCSDVSERCHRDPCPVHGPLAWRVLTG